MTIIIPERGENEDGKSTTFEEAMTKTGFGKFNIAAMFYCGFMLLGMILETLSPSYIIPSSQCDLNMTQSQKGWIAAIPFICIILTSHTWGYIADTRGRKSTLMYTMGAGALFSIMSSFAPDLITFAGLRFVAGFFIAASSSVGYTYLGELTPPKQRSRMIALGNASVGLGTAVVPLLAWAVLPLGFNLPVFFLPNGYRPWRMLQCLFTLPFVICAIVALYFPESPKFLQAQGRPEEALEILKYIYAKNTGKNSDDFPVKEFECECKPLDHSKNSIWKDVWMQTSPLFERKYIWSTFNMCFLQFGTFAISNGLYVWYPTVLDKVLDTSYVHDGHDDENLCSLFIYVDHLADNVTSNGTCNDQFNLTTFTVSIILACIVSFVSVCSAFLLDVIGKRNILLGIFFIVGTCCLVIHWITHTSASVVIFSIMQICGSCIGIISAFAIEIFPTNVRAMAVSLTLMSGRIGSVFGTNLIGYLINYMCPLIFFIFAGILYVCFATGLTLPKDKKYN